LSLHEQDGNYDDANSADENGDDGVLANAHADGVSTLLSCLVEDCGKFFENHGVAPVCVLTPT